MRFSQSAFLAVAATPLLALAQGGESNGSNPFNIPTESLNTEAGETVNLTWQPTTEGTVTIYLRSGASNNLDAGTPIASNIDNSGSFSWSVPDDIVRGSNYALEIVDDSDDTNTNYTPPFVIESDNNAAPSSASSSASASASQTETETDSSSTASETASLTASLTESPSATSTDDDDNTSTTDAASASATNPSNSTSSMTTSTSSRSSSSPTSTSDSDSDDDAQQVTESEGGAARTSAFAGLIGLVVLGAFAL